MAAQETTRGSGSGTPAFVITESSDDENRRQGSSHSSETDSASGFVIIEEESPSRTSNRRVDDATTVTVEQPLPRARRCSICGATDHTARTCQAEGTAGFATRASKRPSKEATGSIAPMVVGTLNFCAVTTFGPECGLTDLEGKLLIPSLQRMLERMPAAAASRAAVIIDPLVILTVLVMWGKRIASIQDYKAKEKYQISPAEAARANGATGTTYSVPAAEQQPVSATAAYRKPSTTTADVSAAVADRARQPQTAETPTNGYYGAPSFLRESLDDNF